MMWALRRIRRFLWDYRHLVFLQRSCSIKDEGKLPAGLSWSCVRSVDDYYRSKLSMLEPLRKKFLKRIARGDYCFIAESQDALAYFVWCTESLMHLPEIGWKLHLDKKTAYMYHIDTLDQFRGKGIVSAIDPIVCHYLAERGISSILGVIEKSNVAVLIAHAKAGFVPVTDLRAHRLFGVWRFKPSKQRVISMLF